MSMCACSPSIPTTSRLSSVWYFTEKRGALVTFATRSRQSSNTDVPDDRPGLIGYDKFWDTVTSNSVLRADPNIGPVLKVSEVLTERVQKAFTRPTYKAMALRVINGLSVHRLTTGGDIYVPVGTDCSGTARHLVPVSARHRGHGWRSGRRPAVGRADHAARIVKTVNGQFISKAPDTEQYYLDLKKDVDYDAQIEKRAEALSDDALDRAYYSAIKQLMERTDESTYVTGHQIWQYQIEWQEHRVDRSGYLFFGAPNDRPTAQPERDFYVYFIQPFEPPSVPRREQGRRSVFASEGSGRRYQATPVFLCGGAGPCVHCKRWRKGDLPGQG